VSSMQRVKDSGFFFYVLACLSGPICFLHFCQGVTFSLQFFALSPDFSCWILSQLAWRVFFLLLEFSVQPVGATIPACGAG
jgi:hypothetical protein